MARRRTNIRRVAEGDHEADDAIEKPKDPSPMALARSPMFTHGKTTKGVARHGGAGRLPTHAQPDTPVHRFNLTCIAMTPEGKIVKRWERGDDPHWVVGGTRDIDGVLYIAMEIKPVQDINYMIVKPCRRAHI